jgi:hypothetical protein
MLNLLTNGERWYSRYGFVPSDQDAEMIAQAMGMIRTLQIKPVREMFSGRDSILGRFLDPSGSLTFQEALVLLKLKGRRNEKPICDELKLLKTLLDALRSVLGLFGVFMRKYYDEEEHEQTKPVDKYNFVNLSSNVKAVLSQF